MCEASVNLVKLASSSLLVSNLSHSSPGAQLQLHQHSKDLPNMPCSWDLKINPLESEQLSAEICSIFETELAIPEDRTYIKYEEIDQWGWNGGNF